ncbi:hypothetical protein DFH08DRAFT_811471 [Mycena albidolilacea]|uniref:Uncharacterized protein n=1 Tax=Mycena albidolilacea TaxID=1033008 RepID=A0AAD7EMX9_9AGAR|nr:hypothetical protein DFH08DRAFT_811471 [Mycena albidolilacea]
MAHDLFTVQELVDAIVYSISDSYAVRRQRILSACALVSRSWVYPTQSLLFHEIHFHQNTPVAKPARWIGLKRTLEISPHLVHHIRRLHLYMGLLEDESILSSICNFPFTHLEQVKGQFYGTMQIHHALDLGQLFSLSTVRQVSLNFTSSAEPQVLPRIFERCSPACRDLELTLGCSHPLLPNVRDAEVMTSIPLKTLRLPLFGSALDRGLLPFLSPFDLPHLKALSIDRTANDSDIFWPEFYPVFNRLEFLSVCVMHAKTLDLSQFSNLSYLCISMEMDSISQQDMARLLSTMTSTHHIRELRVWFNVIEPDLEVCTWVDAVMSTVGIPIVEVRVHEAGWIKFFPRLREKNLVLIVPPGRGWRWDDIIATL